MSQNINKIVKRIENANIQGKSHVPTIILFSYTQPKINFIQTDFA